MFRTGERGKKREEKRKREVQIDRDALLRKRERSEVAFETGQGYRKSIWLLGQFFCLK